MIYDINLIPKAKKKASGEAVFITAALGLGCLVLASFFGAYLPLQQKNALKEQINEQENELASYSASRDYYTSLLSQVEAAGQTDTILKTIVGSNLKMTKIMDDLEKSMPKNITIKQMSMASGLITIDGTAPSYRDMAQYIVNLRKMENVLDVTFLSAIINSEAELQAAVENSSPEDTSEAGGQLHAFTICVRLNSTDVVSGLLAQMAAGEEATADEIN